MAKAQTKASNKYNAKAYDRIALQVKKGQREVIRSYAEARGMSLNGYINTLIREDMKAHGAELDGNQSDDIQSETEIDIEELNLSIRTFNVLKRAGINTTADLKNANTKNIGEKALSEVTQAIEQFHNKY